MTINEYFRISSYPLTTVPEFGSVLHDPPNVIVSWGLDIHRENLDVIINPHNFNIRLQKKCSRATSHQANGFVIHRKRRLTIELNYELSRVLTITEFSHPQLTF